MRTKLLYWRKKHKVQKPKPKLMSQPYRFCRYFAILNRSASKPNVPKCSLSQQNKTLIWCKNKRQKKKYLKNKRIHLNFGWKEIWDIFYLTIQTIERFWKIGNHSASAKTVPFIFFNVFPYHLFAFLTKNLPKEYQTNSQKNSIQIFSF